MMPICSITGDVNFDHLNRVISVGIMENFTNFPFVVNKLSCGTSCSFTNFAHKVLVPGDGIIFSYDD